mmetsp:Transcript_31557/g.94847  ORF Transcript_31557/g.94847 Transcript_31557/m.94847 type:complete len:181 (-) Transcript_31557:353-895(-)
MASGMRERLERRILDLAARLSTDDEAGTDAPRWSPELSQRFGQTLSAMPLPLRHFSLNGPAGSGRGRGTLLRNRLGHSVRDDVVTEPDRIHGRALLKLEVVASDGGEYSSEYKLANLLQQNTATYCSSKSKNIVVVLEHAAPGSFVVTHGVMRSPPRGSFTAPVKGGMRSLRSRLPARLC